MSGRLFGQALEADMPGHVAKLILLKLTDAAEPDGTRIFPGIDSIARVAQCSRRHAQRVVGSFRDVGLLVMVRTGGSGPGDTSEYRLDMTLFRRICKEGWVAVFGPDKGDMIASPLSAEKGDTRESPLDPAGAAEKGDTMSPLKKGDISDKGDIGRAKGDSIESPNPSIDPSKEETETRAREERFEARWRRLTATYPDCAADKLNVARALLHAMPETDREAATGEGLLDFVAWLKGQRGRPHLQDYLRDRRWTIVPKRAAQAPEPGVAWVDPFARSWWALWHRVAEKATTLGGAERERWRKLADAQVSKARSRIGWQIEPARRAEIDTAGQALAPVKVGSAAAAAWAAHYAARGITLPIPDAAEWMFMPAPMPSEGGGAGTLSEEDKRFLEEGAI